MLKIGGTCPNETAVPGHLIISGEERCGSIEPVSATSGACVWFAKPLGGMCQRDSPVIPRNRGADTF
ncbi:hypothetical protein GCM10027018_10670 [Paenibacillus thermoaerophilus]